MNANKEAKGDVWALVGVGGGGLVLCIWTRINTCIDERETMSKSVIL